MKTLTHYDLADMYTKRRDGVKRTIDSSGYPKNVEVVYPSRGGKPTKIYTMKDTPELHQLFQGKNYASIEHGALCAIEQLLGVTLERQYQVLNYRIDGYDSINNIAYEIDEMHHSGQVETDKLRQESIEKLLGCKFVKITC